MKKIFLILCPILILSLFCGCFSMKNLPKGDLLASYPSPDNQNTLEIYLCNGGATVDYAIRGAVTNKDGGSKNIYWAYHQSDAEAFWLDNETVSINGVELNIKTDVYDFRNE